MKFQELLDNKIKEASKFNTYFKFHVKITPFMISEINEISYGLEPRNVFRESRYEWIVRFLHLRRLFKKYHLLLNQIMREMMIKLAVSKRTARQALADYITYLQLETNTASYLMNPVRLSLITTVSAYIENMPQFNKHDPDYIVCLVYKSIEQRDRIRKIERVFSLKPWKVYHTLTSSILIYSGPRFEENNWQLPDQLSKVNKTYILDHHSNELGHIPLSGYEIHIFSKKIHKFDIVPEFQIKSLTFEEIKPEIKKFDKPRYEISPLFK